MTATAAAPRRTWLADRPVGVKIGALIAFSAAIGVLLTVLAVVRISDLDTSQRAMYGQHVQGLAALDAVQESYDQLRDGYTAYYLAPATARPQLRPALTSGEQQLTAAMAGYARVDTHPQRLATLQRDLTAYTGLAQDRLLAALDAGDMAGAGAVATGPLVPAEAAVVADVHGLRQTLRTEAAAATAAGNRSAASAERLLWTILGVSIAVGSGAALLVVRQIVRTVRSVHRAVDALAAGDLTVAPAVGSRDELGRMAASLVKAQASLRGVLASVVTSADAVAASSEELSTSAAQISASAQQTSAQSGVVAGAADEVSRNVATVAAGAQEMGASIREIAANAAEASEVAHRAVEAAATTTATVARLGESSTEIGNVVRVITSIAEQTNLLALNATIEAARAGEAGKGFAVVAHEVKELAQETARATEDIARRVQAIQGDTTAAVAAIDEISGIVATISERQTAIASAVEQQTATTTGMSRSVAEAAGGTGEIASTIGGVSTAAEATTLALVQTRGAVDELSRMASGLRATVAAFTY